MHPFSFLVLFLLKDVSCVLSFSASHREITVIWEEGVACRTWVSPGQLPLAKSSLIHFSRSVHISLFCYLCCLVKGLEVLLMLCHFVQALYSLWASVSSPVTKEECARVVLLKCGCLLESFDEVWKDTDAQAPPPDHSSLNFWGRIGQVTYFKNFPRGGNMLPGLRTFGCEVLWNPFLIWQ